LTIKIKESQREVELQNIDLTVSEDGEPQTVLSLRGMGTGSPITLAVLIQDDLLPPVQTEIKALAEFIRRLPRGSQVLIGFVRSGSLQVRNKFTTDWRKQLARCGRLQGLRVLVHTTHTSRLLKQ